MVAPIKNPYHNPYRSSASAATTMNRSSTVTAEAMIRNLLRANEESSAETFPSLSSLHSLKEQLLVWRDDNDRETVWSNELALEFGNMVANCLFQLEILLGHYDDNDDDDQVGSKVDIGALLLDILTISMDDWNDQLLYAVLVQQNNKNGRSKTLGSHEYLLDRLRSISTRNTNGPQTERIRQHSTTCLAKGWLCLQRLEDFTNLDNGNNLGGYHREEYRNLPWWIPVDSMIANTLGLFSLQSLDQIFFAGPELTNDDEFCLQQTREIYSSADQDQLKASHLTILSLLLRYQALELFPSPEAVDMSTSSSIGGCTIPKAKLAQLASNLTKEIQILNHSVLPSSASRHTLPIAILSMTVLSLLQRSLSSSEYESLFQGLNQTVRSTGLVENLVLFAFSPAQHDGVTAAAPRWTSTENSDRIQTNRIRSLALQLFSCWSLYDNAAWKLLVANLEPKFDALIKSFYWMIVESHSSASTSKYILEEQLPRVLWSFYYMRSHARFKLSAVLETQPGNDNDSQHATSKEMATRAFIRSLFGFLRISSGTSYSGRLMISRLLRVFLSDRRFLSSHDELSRGFWQAIDESVVEGHLQAVLEHANTNDTNQPLVIALLDTMETLLEHCNSCNCLMEKLGAHNLEALIYLLKPNTIRYDFAPGTEEDIADADTETPPLHNLSRMDEASICIEHEETKIPRGLDNSVRLSVATSLAHLAYGSSVAPPNDSIGLLVSRVSTVVNDFFMEYHTTIEGGTNVQANNNSKVTSTALPSMDQIKRFTRFWHRIATPQNEDFLSTTNFASMSLRRQVVMNQMERQQEIQRNLEMALQRERQVQEEKERLQQRLQNQSIFFQREMSRAKTNLVQDTRQLVSMHASERSNAEERSRRLEKEVQEATSELEKVKAELQSAREELQTARSTVDGLHGEIGNLQQQAHDEKAKAEEIRNQAEANQETIQSYEEKLDGLQTVIEEREDEIARVEDTNRSLQDNLEDLFADMCSLAQIYQHNETQEASQRLKNNDLMEALNQKLARERKNNNELTSNIAEIEEENEKLYRKLGKYKERLEQERKERCQDQERKKEEEYRRKRNGPVSYLNSLRNTSSSSSTHENNNHNDRSRSTRSSRNLSSSQKRPPSQHKRSVHERETFGKSRDGPIYEKENSSENYRSSTSQQRRTKYQ